MNWIAIGCISSFLNVSLGAFGAHYLKSKLSEYSLNVFHTAVQYGMFHSLALVLVGLALLSGLPNRQLLNFSSIAFLAGIIVFSGSLILLSITGIKWLGAITPIGGLLFLLGWILFALSSFERS